MPVASRCGGGGNEGAAKFPPFCTPPLLRLSASSVPTGHTLVLDRRRQELFCTRCNDYIYVSAFDKGQQVSFSPLQRQLGAVSARIERSAICAL